MRRFIGRPEAGAAMLNEVIDALQPVTRYLDQKGDLQLHAA